MSFCPEKITTATPETNNCLCVMFSLLSASPLHRTFIFPCDECGGHRKAPPCTRAHTHYIISAAKNIVTQYLKFPLSCYPPQRSTLGFGLMTYWGQEKPSGDMSSIRKRWKRRWVGDRREEMVKDMGGRGLEEGDFAGLGPFITELLKGKVEMLEEGRNADWLRTHKRGHWFDLEGVGHEA